MTTENDVSDDEKRQRMDTPVFLGEDRSHEQKRGHERVPINEEFACIEEFIAEYVSSISPGGVFIRSQKPLPMGTRVNLKFSVIVDDIETVEGEGEVVRVRTDEDPTGMGVAFTRLSAESKELIDRIMERHEKKVAEANS